MSQSVIQMIPHPFKHYRGTYTGETGQTTVQFDSANYKTYILVSSQKIYTILVQNATDAIVTDMVNGATLEKVANGNYNFTIKGLGWYVTPWAISFS